MTQIFVFTAGNKAARAHLEASIRNPVPREQTLATFDSSLHERLEDIERRAGGFYAWGAIPGPRNQPTWQAMRPGDWVLCVHGARYHYASRLVAKFDNPDFARAVWGTDDKGDTWQLMYFLTEPQKIDVALEDLSDLLHSRYMGFTRIGDESLARIAGRFGSVDAFIERVFLGNEPDPFLSVLQAYLDESVYYESTKRGRRYRVLEVESDGALIERSDGGESLKVTRDSYLEARRQMREGDGTITLPDIPGQRVSAVTVAQAWDMAVGADRMSVIDVAEDHRAQEVLSKILRSLRVDASHGAPKPYKPLVLEAVLTAIGNGELTTNRITFDWVLPRVLERFRELGIDAGEQQVAYAFHNLAGDLLWLLAYKGRSDLLDTSSPSPAQLRERISHARLKDRFWDLLRQEEPRRRALEILTGGNTPPPPLPTMKNLERIASSFATALADCGLGLGPRHIYRARAFVVSLATKRLVILTGLSGSGKTQIALRFGEWLGDGRWEVIPVRPDWTGPEPLLGYEDALQTPDAHGRRPWHVPTALRFILRAARDPGNPYLLLLDEMNLAHVERYFADVLSGMESGAPCVPNLREGDGSWRVPPGEPERIPFPANLFVVGTVNVDETTYMFSPKVLDRANTLEFRVGTEELDGGVRKPVTCAPCDPELASALLRISTDDERHNHDPAPGQKDFATAFKGLHALLSEEGFEFGHRVWFEANRFAALMAAAGEPEWTRALDLQVMQKVLPRLHGSRRRLEATLCSLSWWCHELPVGEADAVPPGIKFDPEADRPSEPRLPISFEKLRRMTRTLRANQFVSFTE